MEPEGVGAAVAAALRERDAANDALAPGRSDHDGLSGQIRTLFCLSRRHDLPFSVVSIRMCNGDAGEAQQAGTAAWLCRVIRAEIRQTDLLAASREDHRSTVFCPATPAQGAKALVERLKARADGLHLEVGYATFREDSLTLDDLVAFAERGRHQTGPGAGGPGTPWSPMRVGRAIGARRAQMRAKRLFDLAVVIGAAPLWLPVAAGVALAVKLSDPSAPALFAQERTGRGGRRFRMYKFRSMVPDAEGLKPSLAERSERNWPDFKIEDDPRVTRLGRWLRSSSLDELPQLWNVLRGDMSLVGPRPTSFDASTYDAWHTARLEVAPGITGLWQVEARGCRDLSERIRLDLRYVAKRSFLYDLEILLRTIPAVLWKSKGH